MPRAQEVSVSPGNTIYSIMQSESYTTTAMRDEHVISVSNLSHLAAYDTQWSDSGIGKCVSGCFRIFRLDLRVKPGLGGFFFLRKRKT